MLRNHLNQGLQNFHTVVINKSVSKATQKDNRMKEKKYHESTETIRDRAKMNLDGNFFEPCHAITNEPERLLFLPYRSVY